MAIDVKEEIKAKIDIVDLVTSYGYQLKHTGSDFWCCCPFHNEKTPSFKVDSSRGSYHCFGCGESGDIFSFVMKQEGLSFYEAIQKLGESVGVEVRRNESKGSKQRKRVYALMGDLAIAFNKMLRTQNDMSQKAYEYLATREIPEEAIEKFLIGYAPKSVDKIIKWAEKKGYSLDDLAEAGVIKRDETKEYKKPYFYFSNRLIFSIKDKNGKVVAFSGRQLEEDKKSGKYINSPETIIFKKSRTFFGYDEARKNIVKATNREAIVCEGQIDCIRMHINGFNNAVAPLGTAFTEEHAVLLHRVADTVLLCFDDDGAGHKATIKAAQILLAEGLPIRVVSLPQGDDPDSYIRKNGKEAFRKLLEEKAESIVSFQIRIERGKEKNENDTNGELRVTKAVMGTISKCSDRVLQEVLLKEASKKLDIEYKTLITKLEECGDTKASPLEDVGDAVIEEYQETKKSDKPQKLPSIIEGALIHFILMYEKENDLKECMTHLIPLEIVETAMTRKIYGAWLRQNNDEEDEIRTAVEQLSLDEYKYFVSLLTNHDTTDICEVSLKNKVVYFARQMWQTYLIKLIDINRRNIEIRKELENSLRMLYSATIKGVVHLISNFPHSKYKNRK